MHFLLQQSQDRGENDADHADDNNTQDNDVGPGKLSALEDHVPKSGIGRQHLSGHQRGPCVS